MDNWRNEIAHIEVLIEKVFCNLWRPVLLEKNTIDDGRSLQNFLKHEASSEKTEVIYTYFQFLTCLFKNLWKEVPYYFHCPFINSINISDHVTVFRIKIKLLLLQNSLNIRCNHSQFEQLIKPIEKRLKLPGFFLCVYLVWK